jgi:hypothetical protein
VKRAGALARTSEYDRASAYQEHTDLSPPRSWREITGDSDVVDIRTTKVGINNEKSLANYILGQYAIFQGGDIRFHMSHGWTWRGMVRDWKRKVRKHTRKKHGKSCINRHELLKDWRDDVKSHRTRQTCLSVA